MANDTEAFVQVGLEFSGGLEMVFDNERRLQLSFHQSEPVTMKEVIATLRDRCALKDKIDLFVSGDSVRPGILVLINDADWELEGELDYKVRNKDQIAMISSLHGG